MGRSPRLRANGRRAATAWLALSLLLWQAAVAAGIVVAPMPPIQNVGDEIVICTGHGMKVARLDGGTPVPVPTDHSSPACPCCQPFSAGGSGVILADAASLQVPVVYPAPFEPIDSDAARPFLRAAGPQQPRAPPSPV